MKRLMGLLMALALGAATAGEVEIVHTEFTLRPGGWTVNTTLRHADSGWDHYADAWRIVDEQGAILGARTLLHPHEDEQPFTRGSDAVQIPAATTIVFVEAHDKLHGWSKQRLRVDLSQAKGERFEVRR